jgi:hypothetical protein
MDNYWSKVEPLLVLNFEDEPMIYWILWPNLLAALLDSFWFIKWTVDFGPLFRFQYNFLAWKKLIGRSQRNLEVLAQRLNMFCLFTEIYWSVDEVILKQYWRRVLCDFEEVSNMFYTFNSTS